MSFNGYGDISSMNILKELTKNFQYEENMINPDMRKLISGPFRDILVSKNGICYSRSGKVMKISKTGVYRSLDHHHGHAIQPWRLCALVWHDKSPSLHLDQENIDKYLNLLSFIEVLKNYGDEYELLMDGLKTDYFPLSQREVFNVSTGCLGQATGPFKINHPNEYRKIKWGYFVEIEDQIKLDFQDFKNELSWELEKNLKNETVPDTEDVETVEIEPKEEFDICISDPELGGAPSLIPKTKTDSNNSSKENNKMDDCSDMKEYNSSVTMEAQKEEIEPDDCKDQIADQESLFDELFEACKNSDYARREYLQNELIYMGVSMEEIKAKINALYRAKSETKKVDIKTSSTPPIDELQKLFDRRAQLKKELAKIDDQIKRML
jgi:hypothetical protein